MILYIFGVYFANAQYAAGASFSRASLAQYAGAPFLLCLNCLPSSRTLQYTSSNSPYSVIQLQKTHLSVTFVRTKGVYIFLPLFQKDVRDL